MMRGLNMECPVCLIQGLTNEATVQVDGTVYCKAHGVEVFNNLRFRAARGPHRPSWVPAPPATPVPETKQIVTPEVPVEPAQPEQS